MIDLGVNKEEEIIAEIKVSMTSGVINQWNFTAGIKASTDQTEIDAYNTAQGTDYKAVPEGAFYQLEDLIFSSGISESVGVLVVDRSKLTKGATYLIPLQLEQSEDLETITSDTKKQSASGNAQYGQPIDINLGKEMRAIMFEYITKGWNNSGPKVIKLFTSNDGTNWNEFVEINEGLPTASEGGKTYTSKVFTSPNPFSYLRLTVMESYLGNCIGEFQPGSTSWYACWGMAELKLWGM